MTPTIGEQREAVEAALEVDSGNTSSIWHVMPEDERAAAEKHWDALRAAAETLAIVEWMQRRWPEGWAREVSWYEQEKGKQP